jgi:hypothetical protein
MSALAPDLFTRRFDELVELGRSRLPSLAPGWTDYNAHDPGITLMELLAWVAEAQLYSVARQRRDERKAYAAYFGLTPQGPRPASGLIWPQLDPDSPVSTYQRSLVIANDAPVKATPGGASVFHPTHTILWIPGSIRRVQARLATGRLIDYTAANARGQIAFEPFGASAGANDSLAITFDCHGDFGLFPPRRTDATGALLALGVRVNGASPAVSAIGTGTTPKPVRVQLADGTQTVSCPVVSDTTYSFLRTGICLIDVSQVQGSPTSFTLEVSIPGGSARPPRIVQIGLNVLPIVQDDEASQTEEASGLPDQLVELDVPGLRYGTGVSPVSIKVDDNGHVSQWQLVADLSQYGPADNVAQIDFDKATVLFGNGVNGRAPPSGAKILLSYPVCDGPAANTPRNQSWTVEGILGVYGRNPDAIGGGRAATVDVDRRRQARQTARQSYPLVTAADIKLAALALSDLDVGRAEVVPSTAANAQHDLTTVLAMRKRTGPIEPIAAPETDRWLSAVATQLAPRLILGRRLRVIAPTYVDFSIAATVRITAGQDPSTVSKAALGLVAQRMQLTAWKAGEDYRKFGVAVARSDVSAWLRGAPGVARVVEVQLKSATGAVLDAVSVPTRGLPRLDVANSTVTPVRNGTASP